jgi:hypothetical protein
LTIPEPFTAAALTAGILTNIAADILEHYAQALEGTLVGRMLKWTGLIEPNFDDRMRDTLSKALGLYFEAHPEYKLTGITAFFRDPAVARQIGGYILDRKPIDQDEIEQALARHLDSDAITEVLLKQRGLKPQRIVPDFLECYRRVLNQQLTVPQMGILLEVLEQTDTLVAEIQASEARLKTYIAQLLASRLSLDIRSAAYQASQQELAADLTAEMDAAGLIKPDQAAETIRARLQPLPALFADGLCKGRPLHIAADEYFVSHGLDPDTLLDWRQTLAEALAHAAGTQEPLKPYFSGDTLLGGFRLCGISEKLCATRFSVFLLPPSQDRNVYLELGIAIGLGAPFFLIQHYEADISPVLEGLGRYTRGGLFRTMRREIAGQIEEYDFGAVRFTAESSTAGSQPKYLIAPGGLIEDEDFEFAITEAVGSKYSHLEAVPLTKRGETVDEPRWMLEQLVTTIQTSRFGIYRVDEDCSATTFLALGISIGLNRPFLMVRRVGKEIPLDIQGMGIYQFPSFVILRQQIVQCHQLFFERYVQ